MLKLVGPSDYHTRVVMSDVEEGLSSFSSVEEELEYWKRKSLEYCERSKTLICVCVILEC